MGRPSEEPKSNEERTQVEKLQSLMERIKKTVEQKKHQGAVTRKDCLEDEK